MSAFDSDDEIVLSTRKRKRLQILSESSDESSDIEIERDDSETEGSESDDIDSENSDSDKENEHVEWKTRGGNREPFEFSGNPGHQFIIPRLSRHKPLFYFEKYLDNDLINIIVEQTNLYAQQFLESNPNLKPRSRSRKWYPTTHNEMRCFIALLILQGIVKKPSLQMYYSTRESISTPFFSKVIKSNRFLLLCKFLHFEDNASFGFINPPTKVAKIQTIFQNILHKCQTLYIPEMDICVDESLLMWKGRLSWKQYIPSKRSRFGIKFYVLCESASGYIWNFCIYTGKDTDFGEHYPEYKHSARIVLELCHGLLDRGYRLYLDNWYTSIPLAEKLCTHKTDVIGTIRKNRIGIPSQLKRLPIRRGECSANFKNKIMIMKWQDKREVYILSTVHDANMIDIEKRSKRTKTPEVIVDYNKMMGGVDMSDGIMIAHSSARKRLKKYYKKMFLHFLDIICLNSFIIYKSNKGKLPRVNFLLECIEQTIESYPIQSVTPTVSRRAKPYCSRLIGQHFPDYIPSTSKATPTRRCVHCFKNKIRKESRYWCSTCEVALCIVPCFAKFHSVTKN